MPFPPPPAARRTLPRCQRKGRLCFTGARSKRLPSIGLQGFEAEAVLCAGGGRGISICWLLRRGEAVLTFGWNELGRLL